MPCYNCSETLEEAVVSIYAQNLKISFEVIMVDDGSTDSTRELIIKLSKKYKYIKYFFQEQNKGGGVTRNMAVKNSEGNIIFCLDSDDILEEGVLGKMADYWLSKRCDGVGVSTSIKFKNKNIKNTAFINEFSFINEQVPFESLFQNSMKCPLYSVFLFTREAFDMIGGYPEGHGFDTQGFAFRFLANGLVAYTCPETTYFHRVGFHRSYYIREYEAGKASHNWYSILEEYLFVFSEELQRQIIEFDLNKGEVISLVEKSSNKFKNNYKDLIRNNSKQEYKKLVEGGVMDSGLDYFWIGSEKYRQKKYSEAITWLIKSIEAGLNQEKIYFKLFDSLCQINNISYSEMQKKINSMFNYRVLGSLSPLHKRAINKIKKSLNAIYGQISGNNKK